MDVCHQTPLILGRPFLSAAGANIGIAAGVIQLNINGKEETFAFKPNRTEQYNKVRDSTEDKKKNARHPKKKPDAAKHSTPKYMWRVKNATSTAPPSPVAPAN